MLVNLLTLLRLYGNQIDQRKIDRYISPFLPDSPFLPSLQDNPLWESFMWNFFSSVSQGKWILNIFRVHFVIYVSDFWTLLENSVSFVYEQLLENKTFSIMTTEATIQNKYLLGNK